LLSAAVAKQARYLEQKLKIQRGEADEDDEEQDEQQQQPGLRDKLWGANKRAYYQEEEQVILFHDLNIVGVQLAML
jgi:U3 small nucleolar RNA-associated protein 3